jgi:hypothetical protein
VANRAGAESALSVSAAGRLQLGVPLLDVCRPKLLQWPCSQVWGDLICEQFAVTLCGLWRDPAECFPLVDAAANVFAYRDAGLGYVGALASFLVPLNVWNCVMRLPVFSSRPMSNFSSQESPRWRIWPVIGI